MSERTNFTVGDVHVPALEIAIGRPLSSTQTLITRDGYVLACVEQPLVCVEPLDGAGCTHAFHVNLDAQPRGSKDAGEHLYH